MSKLESLKWIAIASFVSTNFFGFGAAVIGDFYASLEAMKVLFIIKSFISGLACFISTIAYFDARRFE